MQHSREEDAEGLEGGLPSPSSPLPLSPRTLSSLKLGKLPPSPSATSRLTFTTTSMTISGPQSSMTAKFTLTPTPPTSPMVKSGSPSPAQASPTMTKFQYSPHQAAKPMSPLVRTTTNPVQVAPPHSPLVQVTPTAMGSRQAYFVYPTPMSPLAAPHQPQSASGAVLPQQPQVGTLATTQVVSAVQGGITTINQPGLVQAQPAAAATETNQQPSQ